MRKKASHGVILNGYEKRVLKLKQYSSECLRK